MATVNVIETHNAPAAVGPYSQGTQAGGFIFTAGQIALDPNTGKLVGETVAEQTERVMQNLKGILAQGMVGFDRVVKTTCYLTDINDFAAFNEVYSKYFPENPPARSCVAVAALPKGAKVEVECIAVE